MQADCENSYSSVSRRLVVAISISIDSAVTSGCVSLVTNNDTGPVTLSVLNWTNDSREISITVTGDDRTVFEETVELERNESTRLENAFEGGGYTVTAALDTGTTERYAFSMDDCEEQHLTVRIRDVELIEFAKKRC